MITGKLQPRSDPQTSPGPTTAYAPIIPNSETTLNTHALRNRKHSEECSREGAGTHRHTFPPACPRSNTVACARAQRLGVKLTAGHPHMDRKDPFPGGIPLVKGPGGSQHGVPWRGARVMASSESRAPLSAAMTQQSNWSTIASTTCTPFSPLLRGCRARNDATT